MLKPLLLACLFCFSVPAIASCEDVKSQIDAKLQAKGVKSYTLDIVPANQAAAPAGASGVAAAPAKEAAGKVVGTCEGDTRQIVYKRN
ncbi:hypothetical protein MIZ01_1235 [Sideroxyarcus emersonii]|uniref:DUF1161 domain-containing protein n=1 Tax=Sideroxyarcus emersonii TaxID=2764705 RepID=A0AAN2BYW7_9PROT|nr:DUF1161 domain-containing protein [Sideroxyarcus emersonii]BCK87456.1 hypothetical protein MIZ01_1235 [Sideroxyarcus emersonii]